VKAGGFFYILRHEKEHQIFGIRAIIEAIQAGTTVDKAIFKRRSSELMKDLMKVMKRQCKLLLCSCRN
jgi:23S rRNA (guanosine2251-2'-O)-methyltransferase